MKIKYYCLLLVFAAAIALPLLASKACAQSNTFPSSGNVGIGTTSPDELLVLSGSGGYDGLKIYNTTAANGLYLFDDGNPHIEGEAGTILWINGDSSGDVCINSAGGNTLLNVFEGGDVGVGTTSPSQTLDIANGSYIQGKFESTTSGNAGGIQLFGYNGTSYQQFELQSIPSNGWPASSLIIYDRSHGLYDMTINLNIS